MVRRVRGAPYLFVYRCLRAISGSRADSESESGDARREGATGRKRTARAGRELSIPARLRAAAADNAGPCDKEIFVEDRLRWVAAVADPEVRASRRPRQRRSTGHVRREER